MGRFTICDYEEAKTFDDPEGWLLQRENDECCSFLVDGSHGVIIFCDNLEPEDATLDRGLYTLVRYMNALTAE